MVNSKPENITWKGKCINTAGFYCRGRSLWPYTVMEVFMPWKIAGTMQNMPQKVKKKESSIPN